MCRCLTVVGHQRAIKTDKAPLQSMGTIKNPLRKKKEKRHGSDPVTDTAKKYNKIKKKG